MHKTVIRDMDPTRAYHLGYNRGFARRRDYKWPQTIPNPPVDEFAKYHDAVTELRNQLDTWQAGLSPDDEWTVELNRLLDIIDDAEVAFSQWLKDQIEGAA